jgi:hypothetical protein
MPRWRNSLLAILALFAMSSIALAQRDLGTISGTVTDPSGGAVPKAKVTLTEDATGITNQVETNEAGEFIRPLIKPGTYTVSVSAAGFKTGLQKGVEVTSGGRVVVPISLTVGEISQTVEVEASAPLLQTETTTLGGEINSRQSSELPLGGQRVFSFLARLAPGVLPSEHGARDEAGGGFSANGVRSNGQNNFLLNGVDNNVNVIDFLNQTSYVVGPSVEAIGEITVLTNGTNAEYGRGAGGVVNVTLKSGTNQLHGALFEFLQNDDLNANTWENNKNGAARGAYKQNQFGAALGGPIKKNRLFMFGDYQGTRIASNSQALNLGIGGTMTIPTSGMVNGNFSNLLGAKVGTDASGNAILNGQIFDPNSTTTLANGTQTRTAFTGNQIPISRFDKSAASILKLFPSTNASYANGNYPQNDYFIVTPVGQNVDQGDGRVDYHLSDKDSIFGSLSWSNRNQSNGQPLPGALDATYFASQSQIDLSRNATVSWTHIWSPRIISETRAAFTRLVTSRTQADPNTDQFKAFNIGGYDPTTSLNGGLPSTQLGRYSGIGASDWLPSKEYNNVWDFIENVSITNGSHAYKFGAEFRPIKFPFFQVPNPHGNITFSRNSTAYPDASGFQNTTGDEIASLLLGNIYQGAISTNNFISSQKWAWAFFGQDDWKVTSKLTVNLGLRYEVFSPIGEKFGRQSSFDPQTNTLYIPSGKDQNAPLPPSFNAGGNLAFIKVLRGTVGPNLIPTDMLDFSPRIGIAYKLRDKTVLRAGYGVFYGGEENQGGYPNRGEAVPFNETVQLNRTGLGIFDNNPFFSGGLSGGFPSNVFSLDVPPAFRGITQNFRNPLVHKWNFAVQRELPHAMALELSYVGNHQAHGVEIWDPNTCPNNSSGSYNCDNNRPNPKLGGLSFVDSFGFGNYHGFTSKLEKRYSSGLTFTSAYTYGHALADTGTTLTGSSNAGSKDRRNISLGYASAAWDIRHNWVTNFIYDLPFGQGKRFMNGGGVLSKLVGDWQANSVLTFRTGPPVTLTTANCVGTFGTCQPDLVSGKDPKNAPSGGRNPGQWFDTSAVVSPTPGTPGNLGIQSNNIPGQRTVDLSLFKDFRFTEHYKVQFRAEAFNIANTPQWGQPNLKQGDPAFGTITSTQANTQRHVQFALRFQF